MTTESKHRYRRIPGRAFNAVSRDSLWLAEDHLLSVQSNRFSETYRRYYFRDIQAFTIQRIAPLSLWAYLAGAIAAAFLLPGLFFEFQRSFLWISGGLFLAITLALISLGPTCDCYIQTAVSRERLASLHWIRTAEKALAILQPVIEAVQGPLTAELAGLPAPEAIPAAASSTTSPPPLTPPPLPTAKQPDTAWGYELLFSLLLLQSLHSYLSLSYKGTPLTVAGWTVLVLAVLCVPCLIIRQRRFEVPVAVRVLVILSPLVSAGHVYMINILDTLGRQFGNTRPRPLPLPLPGYGPLNAASAILYGILGVAGLILITRYRLSLRGLPPIPSPE